MLERQVEEGAQIFRQGLVVAVSDGATGDDARERVGREGVTGLAKTVARELVQQEAEGERALGGRGPVLVVTPSRGEMIELEAASELRVEGVVLGEPFLGAGLDPEGNDV